MRYHTCTVSLAFSSSLVWTRKKSTWCEHNFIALRYFTILIANGAFQKSELAGRTMAGQWLGQKFWQWNRLFPRGFAEKPSPLYIIFRFWRIWMVRFDQKWNSYYDGNGLVSQFWQMVSALKLKSTWTWLWVVWNLSRPLPLNPQTSRSRLDISEICRLDNFLKIVDNSICFLMWMTLHYSSYHSVRICFLVLTKSKNQNI